MRHHRGPNPRSEDGFTALGWLVGFLVFIAVSAAAQAIAVKAAEEQWRDSGAGLFLPQEQRDFITWAVGGLVGLGAAKLFSDD